MSKSVRIVISDKVHKSLKMSATDLGMTLQELYVDILEKYAEKRHWRMK